MKRVTKLDNTNVVMYEKMHRDRHIFIHSRIHTYIHKPGETCRQGMADNTETESTNNFA